MGFNFPNLKNFLNKASVQKPSVNTSPPQVKKVPFSAPLLGVQGQTIGDKYRNTIQANMKPSSTIKTAPGQYLPAASGKLMIIQAKTVRRKAPAQILPGYGFGPRPKYQNLPAPKSLYQNRSLL